MSRHKPGDRVFVIRNATDDVVYLIGHGVYDGYQPVSDRPVPDPIPQRYLDQARADEQDWVDCGPAMRDDNVAAMHRRGATQDEIDAWLASDDARLADQPPFEDRVRAAAEKLARGYHNPRVTLDDGRGYAWGLTSHIGPAGQWQYLAAGRRVEMVDPVPVPDDLINLDMVPDREQEPAR